MNARDKCEAYFFCAECGELAGRLVLLRGGEPSTERSRPVLEALAEIDAIVRPRDQAALVIDAMFSPESLPVLDHKLPGVAAALDSGDAAALYALSMSYVPFYCDHCEVSYCQWHWSPRRFEDGDIEGIEGNCPKGHFRLFRY
ncbi:MAG: hypothetical protein QOH60_3335 [Mycobacterium sp.]|jgi:hypothetical protein|nr:hypothetical protein [Mycobacterium sp.]